MNEVLHFESTDHDGVVLGADRARDNSPGRTMAHLTTDRTLVGSLSPPGHINLGHLLLFINDRLPVTGFASTVTLLAHDMVTSATTAPSSSRTPQTWDAKFMLLHLCAVRGQLFPHWCKRGDVAATTRRASHPIRDSSISIVPQMESQ